jgi:hypothetical protein
MDSETMNGMFDETDNRRNEKDVLGPVISSESQIVTPVHHHKDQTYAHKKQTTKMSLYYWNICLLISSTWNYRRR